MSQLQLKFKTDVTKVDFTREPIIETIITPKEGFKLVVRNSKGSGQEEYYVDAVEIVSFGHALFLRSSERPKPFLVPTSDYEILEVREARMVLKNVGLDKSIKIAGGREGNLKPPREVEREEEAYVTDEAGASDLRQSPTEGEGADAGSSDAKNELRFDKKRDRRRQSRKRRGPKEERDELAKQGASSEPSEIAPESERVPLPAPDISENGLASTPVAPPSGGLSTLLQPPPLLISETIARYRENSLFKSAFYLSEEDQYKPHDKVQELLSEDEENEEAPVLDESHTLSVPEENAQENEFQESTFDIQTTLSGQEPLYFENPYEEPITYTEEHLGHSSHEETPSV